MGRRPISAIVPPAPSENTYRPSLSTPRSTICAEDVNRASVDNKTLTTCLESTLTRNIPVTLLDATLTRKGGGGGICPISPYGIYNSQWFRKSFRDSSLRTLQRRHHPRDGVIKRRLAVQMRLPETHKQLIVIAPTALVEPLANGVGRVRLSGSFRAARTGAARTPSVLRPHAGRRQQRREHFARCVEDQGVPQVSRNRFFPLPALPNNRRLHRFRDSVRSFVKQHFKRFVSLVPRIGAGNGHAQWVQRRIGPSPIRVRRNVYADFFFRPFGLIDIREPLGNAHALFFNERRDPSDPPPVRSVLIGPQMRSIDGCRCVQNLREVSGQARVAGLLVRTGKFVAVLKIPKLVFQQDQVGIEEQVFIRIFGGVIGDRVVPGRSFRGSERRPGFFHSLQFRLRRRSGLLSRRGRTYSQLGFVIEHVMKIDPESAVKFKDGQRPVSGADVLGRRRRGPQNGQGQERQKDSHGCWAHDESHDSSANASAAQTLDSFLSLNCNTRCKMPARFAWGNT